MIILNNPIQINFNQINSNHTRKKRKIKTQKISMRTSQRTDLNLNTELNTQINEEKIKDIMKYTDDEKNLLSYNLAKQYDDRTFCEYYISLLKTKHAFIFAFFQNNDYNSKIIKIDIFIISFAIYYTINALFFDDNTIHKIYENKGSFNIEYQLPKIIYSSLISIVLNKILNLLALSNDDIIKLKHIKSKNGIDKKKEKLEKILRIKFILFFILGFIHLLFFWYYIAMFGVVYRNTQYHLLKDTLISFGLSLLYPFVVYLLPGMFRIPALSNTKKNNECLYVFSKLLQTI